MTTEDFDFHFDDHFDDHLPFLYTCETTFGDMVYMTLSHLPKRCNADPND